MQGGATQFRVQTRRRGGAPGMYMEVSSHNEERVLLNSNPQAPEVWTLVINTADDDEEYGVGLTDPVGTSVTIDSGTGATAATIAEALATAWNGDPLSRGIASADGTTTSGSVVFTGTYPGIAYAMEEQANAGKMALTNTSDAATADAVPFGVAMIAVEYVTDQDAVRGVIAKASALETKEGTLTATFAGGELYTVTVIVKGQAYQAGPITASVDDATTAGLIEDALTAILPANTVTATDNGDGTVTLEAALAGLDFSVTYGTTSGGNLAWAWVEDGRLTDLNRCFAGVAIFAYDEQQQRIDVEAAEYPPNAGVRVSDNADVWVATSQAVTLGDAVWVELDAGSADVGKFFNTGSATRVQLDTSRAEWLRNDHSTSDAAIGGIRFRK